MSDIPDLHFTEDWFSINIPAIEYALSPFKDNSVNMLEIGCFQGRSTLWFLQNILTHADSRIVCIDPFHGSEEHTDTQKKDLYQIFHNNILTRFPDKVQVFVSESSLALRASQILEKSFDIVYVDGNHKAANVLEDAVLSFRLLNINGIMIFDDYLGGGDQMYTPMQPHMGISAFVMAYKPYLNIVSTGYSMVIQKTGNP